MKIPLLDHGYVEFIEPWGMGRAPIQQGDPGSAILPDYERGIIEAARQSTQGSFRSWEAAECDCDQTVRQAAADEAFTRNPVVSKMLVQSPVVAHSSDCASVRFPGDKNLLQRLFSHHHMTPFEFSGMVIEVQAPIFVFREWHRHRTQSYNEMSARYSPLPDLHYMPNRDNVVERMTQATHTRNIQQMGKSRVDPTSYSFCTVDWQLELAALYAKAEHIYQKALANGIPKELARISMPVGHYSRMRACTNLRNWLGFMTLRCDPAAQWEIRQYANAVGELVSQTFPRTHTLWQEASRL